MHMRLAGVILGLLLPVASVGSSAVLTPRANPASGTVARALDGATLALADGRSVRVFGTSAPRERACFGSASREDLGKLVPPGTRVAIRARSSTRAQPMLADVFVGDSSLALRLLKRGTVAPRRAPGATATETSSVVNAARVAFRQKRGLWGACPAAKLDPRRPVRTGAGPTLGTAVIRLGASWKHAAGYQRYATVIVSRGPYAPLAARQAGRSLIYHSAASVNPEWNSGVPYTIARSKGWLLLDANGTLLHNAAHPENAIGDIGDATFQATWIEGVVAYVESIGADGVFLDDVVEDLGQLTRERYSPTYPTRESWREAMVSFVAAVGKAFRARGLYLLVNAHSFLVGDSSSDDGSMEARWWGRLAPSVDGLMHEYLFQVPGERSRLRSTGSSWFQHWDGWLELVDVAQAVGRDFYGLTYGDQDSTRAMRYMRASFLLAWNGKGGGVVFETSGSDPWHPDWTTSVGAPVGRRIELGRGWLRRFTDGIALVNPSPDEAQAFDLGGRYRTPDGSVVTRLTLEPVTGIVLRRV